MRTPVRVALLGLLALGLAMPGMAALAFLSPSSGQSVSGTTVLSVAAPPSAARVDYRMGSHLLGSAASAPFSLDWNSAEAMDGTSAIQAIAFGPSGAPIVAGEVMVRIANRNVSLVVNAPDLTRPLSGTVALQLTGADEEAWPAIWTLNVDGEEQSTVWTDNTWKSPLTVTFQLNTTRFTNGKHELHISLNSRSGPANPQWVNWRGMVNRVVDFENGSVPMDVQAVYASVYLQPGESVAVGCSLLYTDGRAGSCPAPYYTSKDSTVASVNAAGATTAVKPGFTEITVRQGSFSSTTEVWVLGDAHLPHFSGGGALLNRFDPARSLFVVAPFFLDPEQLWQNGSLAQEVRTSRVNTLSFGVYLNPRNVNAAYSDWLPAFNTSVLPKMRWARDNGFHLLLTGDDIFRQIGTDAWYTLNWPPARQAVEYAAGQLAQSGVGVAIEGIDEANSIWGPRANPQGKIGSAPYLFDRVDCQSVTCVANWPVGAPGNKTTFALQGSSAARLNTPANMLYTVNQPALGGIQFTIPGALNGSYTQANSPNLEWEWYAGPYCANGAICNPVVPNDALATMRGWLNGTVPVAFPPIATAPPEVFRDWTGTDGISDYASHYFTSLKTRTTYPWSEGVQEMVASMRQEFYARQPYMRQDKPQMMLVSLAGPSYTKQAPRESAYLAGADILIEPGVGPEHVSALMMTAAALGGAGERLYYFEPPSDVETRMGMPVGTQLQTGANPENLQTASWRAMSAAAGLLTGVLQPYLLDTRLNAPAYGRNVVTAARAGSGGNMLLLVNGNDWERTITADLTPYRTGHPAIRYRLTATGLEQAPLTPRMARDTVTLEAGESAAYVFPNE